MNLTSVCRSYFYKPERLKHFQLIYHLKSYHDYVAVSGLEKTPYNFVRTHSVVGLKNNLFSLYVIMGARGSVVGWGTMLQAGRSPVRVRDEVDLFSLPNPSSRTMALGSTQPLTEMSTRNLPGVKKRPARSADNLAAICEPNV
jgi:hypothetical protein